MCHPRKTDRRFSTMLNQDTAQLSITPTTQAQGNAVFHTHLGEAEIDVHKKLPLNVHSRIIQDNQKAKTMQQPIK